VATEFPTFTTDGAADDALFRVAGFRVWAVLADSPREWDVTTFVMKLEVGSLPSADIGIAVGVPADGTTDPTVGIEQAFRRYKKIKVWLLVPRLEVLSEQVKPAIEDGRYLLYDGFVDTRQFRRSGQGDFRVEIRCQHKMAQLLAGTSLFSPFVPTNLIDLRLLNLGAIATANTIDRVRSMSADGFWATIIDVVKKMFATIDPDNLLSAALKKNIVLDELQKTNQKAIDLFAATDNLLSLSISDQLCRAMMLKEISTTLDAAFRESNLWSAVSQLGGVFQYGLLPTVGQVTAIPLHPFFQSNTARVVRAGTYFTLSEGEQADDAGDMSLVVGTLLVQQAGRTVFTNLGELQLNPATSSYLAKNRVTEDSKDFAVVRLESLPPWVQATGTTTSAEKAYGPPTNGLVRSATSPPEQSKDVLNQPGKSFAEDFGDRYSKYLTLLELFGRTRRTITTGFRLDVLPWQALRVDAASSEQTEIVRSYGMVESVVLSFDATAGQATTTIDLCYVRSEVDQQELVESRPVEHFMWADKTKELNDLRWSTKEG
jgi:hypothetical protein